MTRGKVCRTPQADPWAGIRVPDHGALKPWKLSVITGQRQKQLDEEVIFTEFMRKNQNASAEIQLIEKTRLQRADAVIAVISSPCNTRVYHCGKCNCRQEQFAPHYYMQHNH